RIAVQTIDGLTECDVGEWEQLSWPEIRQRYPQYFESFERNPATVPYAGGESYQQVQDRAVSAIQQLIQMTAGHLAIVTHNIVGRVYIAHVTGMPTGKARDIQLDNTSISIVEVAQATPKLLTLNAALHLDGEELKQLK